MGLSHESERGSVLIKAEALGKGALEEASPLLEVVSRAPDGDCFDLVFTKKLSGAKSRMPMKKKVTKEERRKRGRFF